MTISRTNMQNQVKKGSPRKTKKTTVTKSGLKITRIKG